jgi:hypothetical protein
VPDALVKAGSDRARYPSQVMPARPSNKMLWDKKLVERYRVCGAEKAAAKIVTGDG